jgi:hypothetical protein
VSDEFSETQPEIIGKFIDLNLTIDLKLFDSEDAGIIQRNYLVSLNKYLNRKIC